MVSRSRLVAAGGALSLIALFGGVALAPAAQGSRAAGSVASRLGPHEAANFGSGAISSYSISSSGKIRVIDGKAGFLGAISRPVDLALSTDGHYLYLLLRGTGGVAAFRIQRHGGRYPLGVITGGLPAADGASGLGVF